MLKILIGFSLIVSLFTFATNPISAFSEEPLPPILDYYPSCEFKVLKTHSVTRKVKYRRNHDQARAIMLETMRRHAKEEGADAIILINLQLITPSMTKSLVSTKLPAYPKADQKSAKLVYSADFIKHCETLSLDTSRPANYNALGEKQAKEVFSVTIERAPVVVQLPTVKKIYHKKPPHNKVSIEQGIYGVKLGASREDIIAEFGMPSIETNILQGELVLGYGRRHWFHFQDNRLVKVSTENSLFDDAFLNMIPLRDVFDDFNWVINEKINYKSKLSTVTATLGIKSSRLNKNTITTNKNEQSFKLHFSSRKDSWDEDKKYTLLGFTLQKIDYTPGEIFPLANQSHSKVLAQFYKELVAETFENNLKIIDALGVPLARIYLSSDEQATIYNSQLIVSTKRDTISKLHLAGDIFSAKVTSQSIIKPWSLDSIKQGETLGATLSKLSEDAYAGDLIIEVDSNNYQANFIFDEKNNRRQLEEVEIVIY